MSELAKDRSDRLRYFRQDAPAWRLLALLIDKLPAILAGAGVLMASVYGLAKLAH